MKTPALSFENIDFAFHQEDPVLTNICWSIDEGDFVAVLGPNGGGKSTLLKLLIGLLTPDSGEIRIFGHAPRQARRMIGYLPQHTAHHLQFPISVLDVVLMGELGKGSGKITPQIRAQGFEMLALVGMENFAARRIGSLSGGQRQRVLIARALMTEPRLLLLDEPTASVDMAASAELYRLLEKLNQSMTIVMVSHDVNSIPHGVRSVACVNRTLHHHQTPELTPKMLHMLYDTPGEPACPIELIAHGGALLRQRDPHHCPQCAESEVCRVP
ncbi:metal ABC transporter ATP-binding protein [Chrysiogenes arsenatis]|uniref:metal ABC transporter ATP-binding protein n=1 Tax=Chrysiogenes arsenatis TaxID=309797 RepID=UPI0003FC465D|nr:metal ABC transporter ATP-binding protein [Chrysiogenes arsenatis]